MIPRVFIKEIHKLLKEKRANFQTIVMWAVAIVAGFIFLMLIVQVFNVFRPK